VSAVEADSGGVADDLALLAGGREVVYGAGALTEAAAKLSELGWDGFDLLATERSLAQADPALSEAAGAVVTVAAGTVPDAAAEAIGQVSSGRLVALGGGRVVDAAKAVAAVTGAEVAALPTTLAGSTMTSFHRLPAGREGEAKGMVRPSVVLADPLAMCSAPAELMRATAGNALAHATDSLFGPRADDASHAEALRAIALLARGMESIGPEAEGELRTDDLALGALLAGDAIYRAGMGLQHALAQSTVAACAQGAAAGGESPPHAQIHSAILPHAIAFQADRRTAEADGLAEALGAQAPSGGALAERLGALAGSAPLATLGLDATAARAALEAAGMRPEAQAHGYEPDDLALILRVAGAPGV